MVVGFLTPQRNAMTLAAKEFVWGFLMIFVFFFFGINEVFCWRGKQKLLVNNDAFCNSLPETKSKFAPEKWWLEDYMCFPFWLKGLFSGAFAVSFRDLRVDQ